MRRQVARQRHLLGGGGSRARCALLWCGSTAIPLLHAATLCAVCAALHVSLGVGQVAVAYLAASAAAALVPSPGGFGSLDASLVALLTAVGAPTATALAAVLGYRLVTVWLPLAPSAVVCAVLVRRRAL
ncbi:hypothetical protein BCD49_05535 [Pseudofrankia sp. EUN1h]|nr:hypothetical protein BCD49_05535 [Pseudofrankia sp. EUN1h]